MSTIEAKKRTTWHTVCLINGNSRRRIYDRPELGGDPSPAAIIDMRPVDQSMVVFSFPEHR